MNFQKHRQWRYLEPGFERGQAGCQASFALLAYFRSAASSATPVDFMGSPSEVEHVAGLKRDDVLAVGTIRAGAANISSHSY
jgi:hypothetical protein